MKNPNGFIYDALGNKSSSRLCFVFIHLLVAMILFYSVYEHYMTSDIRDVCLGLLGIGWFGKVAQAYRELNNANQSNP